MIPTAFDYQRATSVDDAIAKLTNEAAIKAWFRELNLTAVAGTPQDMAKLKREETERWTKVIRDAGIEPESPWRSRDDHASARGGAPTYRPLNRHAPAWRGHPRLFAKDQRRGRPGHKRVQARLPTRYARP